MPPVLAIPPELAVLVEEQAVAAGYASALDYLYALVINDRRSHLRTSLTTKEMDGLPGKAELIAALSRFEGLAPADFKFDRDQANER